MAYTIRALSFGEILDSGFKIYRDNFLRLAAISWIIGVPLSLLQGISPKAHRGLYFLLFMILLAVLAPIMRFALTAAVADLFLDRPITVGDAYRNAIDMFKPILATSLLESALLMLGILGLFIPFIYFATCWSLLVPIMVVEHRFGMAGLRRSRKLVNGVWWRTLGIIIVALMIAQVPGAILNIFWNLIPIVGRLLTAFTTATTTAYGIIVIAIYYFDRRCRVEDFDLRLLAEQVRSDAFAPASSNDALEAN